MHRPQANAAQGAGHVAPPVVTPEIAAEAAVWVARLHGPSRSDEMERECRAWQVRSSAHRLAFERCTDTWQDVVGVTLTTYATATGGPEPKGEQRLGRRFSPGRLGLALTASALVGVLVLLPWRGDDVYDTGVGEQRIVVLQDGSRMSLNTATRVRVELTQAQRTVKVEGGEALFEVAKDAGRPFVVKAAGAEVVATGTAFLVRSMPAGRGAGDALAVTLVEGQVIVRDAASSAGRSLSGPVVMTPGERLRLRRSGGAGSPGAAAAAQVDRPRMDQVLAWRRGEVAFDDASLPEAVAEMNRYSSAPITVAGAGKLSTLRVSGVFRTGDNLGFARAVARLHGLVVREGGDRLELAPQ